MAAALERRDNRSRARARAPLTAEERTAAFDAALGLVGGGAARWLHYPLAVAPRGLTAPAAGARARRSAVMGCEWRAGVLCGVTRRSVIWDAPRCSCCCSQPAAVVDGASRPERRRCAH